MENGFCRHPRHHVDGLVEACQHRMRLDNAFQRLLVGGGDFIRQRGVGKRVEGIDHPHIALAWRRPVELGHRRMLLFQIIAEHRDPDINNVQRLAE